MDVQRETLAQHVVNNRRVTFPSGQKILVGELFEPIERPTIIAVVNGATGVPAKFYRDFANWLATERGVACLIYDYRDFGASSVEHLRYSQATMADWSITDQEAARSFAKSTYPDAEFWFIGHSLGTMCLPFQQDLREIDRVISVATGHAHVGDHPWPFQAFARLFWYGHFPLITLMMGYLPGRRLKIGADLPAGVYWQWRRWCTQRGFFANDFGKQLPTPNWQGVQASVKIIAIADDVMIPTPAVWRTMSCYVSAPKTQLVLRPETYGLRKIGHIPVLSKKCAVLWDDIIA